jgi:SNF2 family DNA or RNA helicase
MITEYRHQTQSLEFLAPRSEVFDMSEPGTGKTYVHLKDFARKHAASRKAGIVFASKSLLLSAWAEDAAKFTPELRVSVAFAKNRAEAFEPGYDLYITNHDAVKWVEKNFKQLRSKLNLGHMKVDESTAYKHSTSLRGKAAAKIRKDFETCDLLSGTADPNGPLDLWHQAYILDLGKRLGPSFFKFRNAVCEPVQTGPKPNMVEWVPKEHAGAAVAARLADCSIRHKLEDCVDMPQKVMRVLPFRLGAKHRAIYDKMERDSIVELGDRVINAVNGAALWTKLLQIASGSVYGDVSAELVDEQRYEMTMDLVEERPHSIVIFQWKHQRDKLIEMAKSRGLSHAVIDGETTDTRRKEIVDAFQKGFYRFLLGHPQSMAHGLTLTRGVATIWPSPTINLEHWEQANRRIYRIGQTQRTETIVIVAEGTRDQDAYDSCMRKEVSAIRFANEIKSYHS